MGRKKQVRFAELRHMRNVVEGHHCDPHWFVESFGSNRPIVVELGCGRAEYTLALARCRPGTGVLAVDRNGSRLWKGATAAQKEGLTNAVFLRSPIERLEDHLPGGRVSEIVIPFPDPLRKSRQAKHRLLSPGFLRRYRRLLSSTGTIFVKTDDADLLAFAERAVRDSGGYVLHGFGPDATDLAAVQTTYEKRYRQEGRVIHERRFRFPDARRRTDTCATLGAL